MLLRIPKHQLRQGMFVELVECESKHFSRRQFMLETGQALNEILNSPATSVLVNKSKSRVAMSKASWDDDPGTDQNQRHAALSRELRQLSFSVADALLGALNDRLNTGLVQEVADAVSSIVSKDRTAFYQVTRLRSYDDGTFKHSLAVSGLMMSVGRASGMGEPIVRTLGLAGLLHDVGKLTIPSHIINKAGPLTDEEREIVRRHPDNGHTIISRVGIYGEIIKDIVRHHHELMDGSGYPDGLCSHQLSMPVRIATVCDVFDALTSERPYKKSWAPVDALRWLTERPEQFDRKIVGHLCELY